MRKIGVTHALLPLVPIRLFSLQGFGAHSVDESSSAVFLSDRKGG